MYSDRNFPTYSKESQTDDESSSDDEDKRTIYCRNLSDRVSEELLCELFMQAGPVESVRIPTDKDGRSRNFGFVTYIHSCSVRYALELFNGVQLFNRTLMIRLSQNPQQQQQQQESRLPLPIPNLNRNRRHDNEKSHSHSNDNNLSLRLGGSSLSKLPKSNLIRDKNMEPRQHRTSNDKQESNRRNPFNVDLDTLMRLSSNLLPPKEQKQKNNGNDKNKTGNPNNPFAKSDCQRGGRNGDREQNLKRPYDNKFRDRDKSHPYRRNETERKFGFKDRRENNSEKNKNRNNGKSRRR